MLIMLGLDALAVRKLLLRRARSRGRLLGRLWLHLLGLLPTTALLPGHGLQAELCHIRGLLHHRHRCGDLGRRLGRCGCLSFGLRLRLGRIGLCLRLRFRLRFRLGLRLSLGLRLRLGLRLGLRLSLGLGLSLGLRLLLLLLLYLARRRREGHWFGLLGHGAELHVAQHSLELRQRAAALKPSADLRERLPEGRIEDTREALTEGADQRDVSQGHEVPDEILRLRQRRLHGTERLLNIRLCIRSHLRDVLHEAHAGVDPGHERHLDLVGAELEPSVDLPLVVKAIAVEGRVRAGPRHIPRYRVAGENAAHVRLQKGDLARGILRKEVLLLCILLGIEPRCLNREAIELGCHHCLLGLVDGLLDKMQGPDVLSRRHCSRVRVFRASGAAAWKQSLREGQN
mmetsp:Transcript_44959/g.101775  ORF Transcript_44959/g.101775 Transcript_44959/m.101775 type:complete len:399 (+) Transcript_44959:2631-3827(+)